MALNQRTGGHAASASSQDDKETNARSTRQHALIVSVLSVIAAGLTVSAGILGVLKERAQETAASKSAEASALQEELRSLRAPTVPLRLDSLTAKWLGQDGRYEISGKVYGLTGRQFVWTYNQPHDYDNDTAGPVYPDPGPCPVDKDGNFTCKLGYAGSEHCDGARKFTLWAAVVTDSDAYLAATIKSGLEGRDPFPDPGSVPHVDGDETMVSVQMIHPGTRANPQPIDC